MPSAPGGPQGQHSRSAKQNASQQLGEAGRAQPRWPAAHRSGQKGPGACSGRLTPPAPGPRPHLGKGGRNQGREEPDLTKTRVLVVSLLGPFISERMHRLRAGPASLPHRYRPGSWLLTHQRLLLPVECSGRQHFLRCPCRKGPPAPSGTEPRAQETLGERLQAAVRSVLPSWDRRAQAWLAPVLARLARQSHRGQVQENGPTSPGFPPSRA